MAGTFTSERVFTAPGISGTSTTTVQAEGLSELDVVIPNGSTDKQVDFRIQSNLVGFAMISDRDVTVKTDDAGSPSETFALVANVPRTFITGDTAIVSGLRPVLFVTNSSGAAATLKISLGYTP